MKICLIGNSHIACIREAWAEDNFGMDVTFFGSHAKTTLYTENINNVICGTNDSVKNNFKLTSGAESGIELNKYDIAVIHGLVPHLKGYKNQIRNKESAIYYSSEVIKKSNPFYASPCCHLLSEIRKTSNLLVYVSHAPFPATPEPRVPTDERHYMQLVEVFSNCLAEYSAKPLFQHSETIVDVMHTKEHFSKGSKRLAVGNVKGVLEHPEDDIGHMNKDFGRYYLENLRKIVTV